MLRRSGCQSLDLDRPTQQGICGIHVTLVDQGTDASRGCRALQGDLVDLQAVLSQGLHRAGGAVTEAEVGPDDHLRGADGSQHRVDPLLWTLPGHAGSEGYDQDVLNPQLLEEFQPSGERADHLDGPTEHQAWVRIEGDHRRHQAAGHDPADQVAMADMDTVEGADGHRSGYLGQPNATGCSDHCSFLSACPGEGPAGACAPAGTGRWIRN